MYVKLIEVGPEGRRSRAMNPMGKRYKEEKERLIAQRLQAAGIPIAAKVNHDEADLLIRQDNEAYESMVFDHNGGTGLILPLSITPNMPVFILSAVDFSLSRWPGVCFRPLDQNHRDEWPHYNFYGRSELKFSRSEIINRFLSDGKTFRRGHQLRGLLLASSYDRMPDELASGEVLQGEIKLYDQWERAHSGNINLRIHRELVRDRAPDPRRKRLSASPDGKEGILD